MSSPEPKPDRVVGRLHYAKNIAGLAGFATLFLYCTFLLFTTNDPGGQLFYAIAMFALLLTVARIAKRVVAIRRILAADQE